MTLFKAPEFLVRVYSSNLIEYLDKELLPEFFAKFTLPKEEEWQAFLEENMPVYKQSHKRAEKR